MNRDARTELEQLAALLAAGAVPADLRESARWRLESAGEEMRAELTSMEETAGLVGLGRSLAKEFASRNITVNIVAPGPVQTDITGFEEITPYKGGWCGNDCRPDIFNAKTREIGIRQAPEDARGRYRLQSQRSSRCQLIGSGHDSGIIRGVSTSPD